MNCLYYSGGSLLELSYNIPQNPVLSIKAPTLYTASLKYVHRADTLRPKFERNSCQGHGKIEGLQGRPEVVHATIQLDSVGLRFLFGLGPIIIRV